jgi:hypothetical protein
MRKQSTAFVKAVSVSTDSTGNRNRSCRQTGLKITVNGKM